MVNNEKIWVEVLKDRFGVMTNRERHFAEGVVDFYTNRGKLSQRQVEGARKLAVRLILEKDGQASFSS